MLCTSCCMALESKVRIQSTHSAQLTARSQRLPAQMQMRIVIEVRGSTRICITTSLWLLLLWVEFLSWNLYRHTLGWAGNFYGCCLTALEAIYESHENFPINQQLGGLQIVYLGLIVEALEVRSVHVNICFCCWKLTWLICCASYIRKWAHPSSISTLIKAQGVSWNPKLSYFHNMTLWKTFFWSLASLCGHFSLLQICLVPGCCQARCFFF